MQRCERCKEEFEGQIDRCPECGGKLIKTSDSENKFTTITVPKSTVNRIKDLLSYGDTIAGFVLRAVEKAEMKKMVEDAKRKHRPVSH